MADNDLNEVVQETVSDAEVMTVPIDDTLTVSGEAADAKAVGDALALKADRSELQNAVTVNGQSADAQGHIIVDASEINMSDSDTTKVKAAIEAAAGRTGADIPVDGTVGAGTISAALANLDAKAADAIRMAVNDDTTVNAKISALESDMVHKSTDIVDDLATADNTKALSAKQGKALADLIGRLSVTTDTKSGSTPITMQTVSGHQYLIAISASSSGYSGLYIAQGGASNAYCYAIKAASDLTLSVSGTTVTWSKAGSQSVRIVTYDVDMN